MDYTTTVLRTSHKESIIRIVKGLLLSLLLHLLILLLLTKNLKEIIFLPPQSQEKKISLNIQQVVTPPPIPKPQPLIIPPVPHKPIVEKKEIKKNILDKRKKVFAQKHSDEDNLTRIEKKPVKKLVQKKVKQKPKRIVKKKHVVKKRKTYPKPKRSYDPLANLLMGSSTTSYSAQNTHHSSNTNSYANRVIKRLYGKEFNTYSKTQKKFIKNNLGTIHRITQRTLSRNGYPDIAISTKQQGTNVVAFYLHPNGDITGLKLNRHIGYEALDKNTLQVIRLAYKDYPLPNQKTKIIFYVKYSIY